MECEGVDCVVTLGKSQRDRSWMCMINREELWGWATVRGCMWKWTKDERYHEHAPNKHIYAHTPDKWIESKQLSRRHSIPRSDTEHHVLVQGCSDSFFLSLAFMPTKVRQCNLGWVFRGKKNGRKKFLFSREGKKEIPHPWDTHFQFSIKTLLSKKERKRFHHWRTTRDRSRSKQ